MSHFKSSASPVTKIFYEDIGAGQPVVLIHGWPLSSRMWESQVGALLDAGYRVVTYDRRGFGLSGRPVAGYDYDTFASDLNDLMTTLDLKNAVLAGFSMGGGEVARYIGRYGEGRVAKALLLGAVTPFLLQTPEHPEGAPKALFDGMVAGVKKDRVNFLASFFPKFFNLDKHPHAITEDALNNAKAIAWSASPIGTWECITAFGTTDFRDDLRKVTVPVLVVHGDADQTVPIEISGKKAAAMLKSARFEVLKGAPHGFAATHAEALNALLLDFLKG